MEINYLPSPNYWNYNFGVQIVTWHRTASGVPGDISQPGDALGWLRNPASQASSNYLIGKDGKIYCLVNPENGYSAWANGVVNAPNKNNPYISAALNQRINLNLISISIEHEATAEEMYAYAPLTFQQERATLELTNYWFQKKRFSYTENRLVFHREIDLVNRPYCPGLNKLYYLSKLMNMNNNTINGFLVTGPIRTHYDALGDSALPMIGYPVGPAVTGVDGVVTQPFEKSTLQFLPQYAGTRWEVQAMIVKR